MTATVELLQRIPMFAELDEAELAEVVSCFAEVKVSAGDCLYVEGEPATDACFLVEGQLEARKALPGGGDTVVGTLGPGTMIGEMALIADGIRTASVCACGDATVLRVSYHFFHAALDQMRAPAFKILRAVIIKMTERLDELRTRILEQLDCEGCLSSFAASGSRALVGEPPSFPVQPFLSAMPRFKQFTEREIDELLSRGELFEVPRGEFLFREGGEPDSCWLLLHGAAERSILRDRRYQLAIVGPGRLCGNNATLAERPYSSDARVRSGALVLRLSMSGLIDLFRGDGTCCLKFQNFLSVDQLIELKAADNLLALLVNQRDVRAKAGSWAI